MRSYDISNDGANRISTSRDNIWRDFAKTIWGEWEMRKGKLPFKIYGLGVGICTVSGIYGLL